MKDGEYKITIEDMRKTLAKICIVYGRRIEQKEFSVLVSAWYDIFAQCDKEDFNKAVSEAIKHEKYFPTPAIIRDKDCGYWSNPIGDEWLEREHKRHHAIDIDKDCKFCMEMNHANMSREQKEFERLSAKEIMKKFDTIIGGTRDA
jgi:hypothetical protein